MNSFRRLTPWFSSALSVIASSAVALPTFPDRDFWATNGDVYAIVRDGNVVYVGGTFDRVGPATGGGAIIDAVTGNLTPTASPFRPKVNGVVTTVVPDGSGGWYIGGAFNAVGGLVRNNAAHILGDGTVGNWNPNLFGGGLYDMKKEGNTIYFAGWFSGVGGIGRRGLAAVNATSGAVLPWNPGGPDWAGNYQALAVGGGVVYVGGNFSRIGGNPGFPRDNLAALDAATGALLPWNPGADGVSGIALMGNTLYVRFENSFANHNLGGQLRGHLAAVDAVTGVVTSFDPRPNTGAWPFVHHSTLYVCGGFSTIAGTTRHGLAAFDSTGSLTSWDPDAGGNVRSVYPTDSTVFVCGDFTSIGGQSRTRLARVDPVTGIPSPWDPKADDQVAAVVPSGPNVFAGGSFSLIGGVPRNNIAAFSATTGRALPWNPDANSGVMALAVSGSLVYAGGDFTMIGGQPRNRVAALNATTGAVTPWNPNADDRVNVIAPAGDRIYVGGNFSTLGELPRAGIAAVDADGAPLPWNPGTGWSPGIDGVVNSIALDGGTVYLGGHFADVGGLPRQNVAAVDSSSSVPKPWNPGANNIVKSLIAHEGSIYAGGYFTEFGGTPRNYLGAVDATTGLATPWSPNAQGWAVLAMQRAGDKLYVGGDFSAMNGQTRVHVAELDLATGLATSWSSNATHYVYALGAGSDALYVGGAFSMLGGQVEPHLAAFNSVTLDAPRREVVPAVELAPILPTPTRNLGVVRFSLPVEQLVTLAIFDVQGRCRARPVDGEILAAGVHRRSLSTAGWQPGIYFVRLAAAGRSWTQRFVVTH